MEILPRATKSKINQNGDRIMSNKNPLLGSSFTTIKSEDVFVGD
ncbi:MAG: hypothetical protein RMX68_015605 [Aulosira sp. ZfuVER01]